MVVQDPEFNAASLAAGERNDGAVNGAWNFTGASGVRKLLNSEGSPGVVDGIGNSAWVNAGALWQTLAEQVQGYTRYVLQVNVFRRLDTDFPPYSVQLRVGSTVLAEGMVDLLAGHTGLVKVIFSTEPGSTAVGAIGQQLVIYLMGTGKQVNFFNVTMTRQPCTLQSSTSTTTSSSSSPFTDTAVHPTVRAGHTPKPKNPRTTHTRPSTTTTSAPVKVVKTTRHHTSEPPSTSTSSSSAFDGPNLAPDTHNRRQTITGFLNGEQEIPPLYTTAVGIFSLTVKKDGTLQYEVKVFGITLTAMAMSGIYKQNGDLVLAMAAPYFDYVSQSIIFKGHWETLSNSQLEWLGSNTAYINVMTSAHPTGLVRGSVMGFNSLMFPPTMPPVTTPAINTASVPPITIATSVYLSDVFGHSGVALLNIDTQYNLRFTVYTNMPGSNAMTVVEFHGPSAQPINAPILQSFQGVGKMVTGIWYLSESLRWDLKNGMLYITAFGQNNVVIAGQITGFNDLYIPVPVVTPYPIANQSSTAVVFFDVNSLMAGNLIATIEAYSQVVDLMFNVLLSRPNSTIVSAAFVNNNNDVLHAFQDNFVNTGVGWAASGVWLSLTNSELDELTNNQISCTIVLADPSETLTVIVSGFVKETPTMAPTGGCDQLADGDMCNTDIGNFVMPVESVTTALSTVIYADAADIDNDGLVDIVGVDSILGVATYYPESINNVTQLVQFGQGFKIPSGSSVVPVKVKFMDANGDNFLDVYSVWFGTGTVQLNINQGDGTFFAPVTIFTGSRPHDIDFLDVNNDGVLDLIVVSADTEISWCEGASDGTYGGAMTLAAAPAKGWSVVAVDLNNDGYKDILAVFTTDGEVYWYKNNGEGTFSAKMSIGALVKPIQVDAADMNNDGCLDIVAIGSAGLFVYYCQPGLPDNMMFDPTTTPMMLYGGSTQKSFDLADLNQDAIVDVAVTDFGKNLVMWLQQKADGSFVQHNISTTRRQPSSVHARDLDGDGIPDLVMSFFGSASIAWAKNGVAGNCSAGQCIGISGVATTASSATSNTMAPSNVFQTGEYNLVNFNNPSNMGGFGVFETASNDTLMFGLYSKYMLPFDVQIVLDDQTTLFHCPFTVQQQGPTTITSGSCASFGSFDRALLAAGRLKIVQMPSDGGAMYVGALLVQ